MRVFIYLCLSSVVFNAPCLALQQLSHPLSQESSGGGMPRIKVDVEGKGSVGPYDNSSIIWEKGTKLLNATPMPEDPEESIGFFRKVVQFLFRY